MTEVHKIITLEELNTAFQIRREVFVKEQEVAEDIEYDEFENTSNHYIAFYNGKPAATARWRTTGNGIKLERFAVLGQYRNKGIGMEILLHIVDEVKMLKPLKIYLHAQVQVVEFYQKAGFYKVGEQFEEAGIQHYKMLLAINE